MRFGHWLALLGLYLLARDLPYLEQHGFERDDTDPPGGRSGLTVLTDNRTGLQYIYTRDGGGLTVRLDVDGKPLRTRP